MKTAAFPKIPFWGPKQVWWFQNFIVMKHRNCADNQNDYWFQSFGVIIIPVKYLNRFANIFLSSYQFVVVLKTHLSQWAEQAESGSQLWLDIPQLGSRKNSRSLTKNPLSYVFHEFHFRKKRPSSASYIFIIFMIHSLDLSHFQVKDCLL